ncbi:DUF1878 family protein [Paenibacillus zeisoli]|uniref:DUF1878 family protein n=1 Tax=Paenibacillus zeisoli TaxID=2496267 RepID=A0A433X294_9BACL|nr:DUF1878 family protein [Paenibacillus zeisoli]RUT28110.1 DUF1878 family protein [Paenibacillus zeisoli]
MTIEARLELLTHQVNLLKRMIPSDAYPFFMFVLNHNFTEKQMDAILKILRILNWRFKQDYTSPPLHEIQELQDELSPYSINTDHLLRDAPPNLEEFSDLSKSVLGTNFQVDHLLLSLKGQHIFPPLCEFLLNQEPYS